MSKAWTFIFEIILLGVGDWDAEAVIRNAYEKIWIYLLSNAFKLFMFGVISHDNIHGCWKLFQLNYGSLKF